MISAPPFFRDEFGIGQIASARIQRDVAMQTMTEVHIDAFQRGYVPPPVRASARRRFTTARAQHDRALAVLRHMGATR